MNYILLLVAVLSIQLNVVAQTSGKRVIMEASERANHYYVDLHETDALVFEMETFLHGPEMGYAIRNIDTLIRQSNGAYAGRQMKIIKKKDALLYLIRESKKKKEIPLVNVADSASANAHLNNAYYLERYFEMSKEINNVFPLWNGSWDRFSTWQSLNNKVINYRAFRAFADERIKLMKDSIVEEQNRCTVLMNYLIQNIATINYMALRDSVAKLLVNHSSAYFPKVVHHEHRLEFLSINHSIAYFQKVIYQVAKEQPEFFFRLAEEYTSKDQYYFFNSIGAHDKDVLAKLKLVEGHDKIKKAFFKDIKFRKRMPFVAVGLALAECVGLVLLFVAIF